MVDRMTFIGDDIPVYNIYLVVTAHLLHKYFSPFISSAWTVCDLDYWI